jgi:hypothetical protein
MKRLAQEAPYYEAKTIHYPDGGVETVVWRRHERSAGPGIVAMGWGFTDAEKEAKRKENNLRSVRRARTKIRRLSRSMGLDRMLTFTTRESVTDYDELVQDWDSFRRLLHKEHPGFAYLAVAEPHPSNPGHWHIHVGVRGYHDVNILRRCWIASLRRRIKCEGSPGNVQVEKKRGGSPERLASYLAKYLGKTFEDRDEFTGRRRYWSPVRADVIKVTRWTPAAETWEELEIEILQDECIRQVRFFNVAPGVLWLQARVAEVA